MSRRARGLAVAIVAVVAIAGSSAAMDVRRLAFDEVVDRADSIVHGTVSNVTSGRDADGIPATWITLAVAECLKGGVGTTLTIKQAGVQEPLPDGALFRIPGLPRYRAGEEVVLFLHAASGRGFTSPVGMGQGLYRVEGGRTVRKGDATSERADLTTLVERVRARVGR